ncbi:hypothetical protein HPB52_008248 [Rhipicephalus sanguineus]|uniref:Uncharacterized protein n=1 Tax=Rhipicephalus sanguineus TaxID=34632 RepID=A0A9D4Q5J7_RHISA|nr:hypothetical protein HPB52_008248 [Rhipicephalus sanguineus]
MFSALLVIGLCVQSCAWEGSRCAQKENPLPISCAVQSLPPQVSLQEQTSISVSIAKSAIEGDAASVNDFYMDTAEDDGVGCPMEIHSEYHWIAEAKGFFPVPCKWHNWPQHWT